MLLPPLFAIVMDVIVEISRSVVNELLHADVLALMAETKKNLKERFSNWKDAQDSKGCKVNIVKAKVKVSSRIENCSKAR